MSLSARKAFGGVVLGIVTILTLLSAWLLAANNWQSSAAGQTVVVSYVNFPEGTMYGDYCRNDGTIIDGGYVCHAYEAKEPYTTGERVEQVIAIIAAVLLVGAVVFIVIKKAFFRSCAPRIPVRHRPHPQS